MASPKVVYACFTVNRPRPRSEGQARRKATAGQVHRKATAGQAHRKATAGQARRKATAGQARRKATAGQARRKAAEGLLYGVNSSTTTENGGRVTVRSSPRSRAPLNAAGATLFG